MYEFCSKDEQARRRKILLAVANGHHELGLIVAGICSQRPEVLQTIVNHLGERATENLVKFVRHRIPVEEARAKNCTLPVDVTVALFLHLDTSWAKYHTFTATFRAFSTSEGMRLPSKNELHQR